MAAKMKPLRTMNKATPVCPSTMNAEKTCFVLIFDSAHPVNPGV